MSSTTSAKSASAKRQRPPPASISSKRSRVASWLDDEIPEEPQPSIERAATPPSQAMPFDITESPTPTPSCSNFGSEHSPSSDKRQELALALQQALTSRLIFEASLHQTPSNWEELKQLVALPRTSPEPTQDDHRRMYSLLQTSHFNKRTYHSEVVSPEYLRSIWYATLELAVPETRCSFQC